MIKLVSAEGHEFYVHRKCAMVSGTIKVMLSGQFAESRGEIKFPEISGLILEKLVQYLYYKVRYTNIPHRVPNFNIEPVGVRGNTQACLPCHVQREAQPYTNPLS